MGDWPYIMKYDKTLLLSTKTTTGIRCIILPETTYQRETKSFSKSFWFSATSTGLLRLGKSWGCLPFQPGEGFQTSALWMGAQMDPRPKLWLWGPKVLIATVLHTYSWKGQSFSERKIEVYRIPPRVCSWVFHFLFLLKRVLNFYWLYMIMDDTQASPPPILLSGTVIQFRCIT